MRKTAYFALLVFFAAASVAPFAAAQDKKREAQLRTVRGLVLDKQDNAIVSGVVYLKNLRTQTVKTYISNEEGRYRFSGLDPNVDYEIHAEHEDASSPTRTVSSFDTRKDMVINLKVDRKRGGR